MNSMSSSKPTQARLTTKYDETSMLETICMRISLKKATEAHNDKESSRSTPCPSNAWPVSQFDHNVQGTTSHSQDGCGPPAYHQHRLSPMLMLSCGCQLPMPGTKKNKEPPATWNAHSYTTKRFFDRQDFTDLDTHPPFSEDPVLWLTTYGW